MSNSIENFDLFANLLMNVVSINYTIVNAFNKYIQKKRINNLERVSSSTTVITYKDELQYMKEYGALFMTLSIGLFIARQLSISSQKIYCAKFPIAFYVMPMLPLFIQRVCEKDDFISYVVNEIEKKVTYELILFNDFVQKLCM